MNFFEGIDVIFGTLQGFAEVYIGREREREGSVRRERGEGRREEGERGRELCEGGDKHA